MYPLSTLFYRLVESHCYFALSFALLSALWCFPGFTYSISRIRLIPVVLNPSSHIDVYERKHFGESPKCLRFFIINIEKTKFILLRNRNKERSMKMTMIIILRTDKHFWHKIVTSLYVQGA